MSDDDKNSCEIPDLQWIEADKNHWSVPVLDLRPFTTAFWSASQNPECASNAMSFANDDGTGFIGVKPPVSHRIDASLHFPTDGSLANGVLFRPRQMEHKWAIFFHRPTIICVRSWLRKVELTAEVRQGADGIEITSIEGVFTDDDEAPNHTLCLFDCLLRNYALDVMWPVPITPARAADPKDAAVWCFSLFGNRAGCATPHTVIRHVPQSPLRSISLLHIAVARGDTRAVESLLAKGVPIDLLGRDGLTPLHWSVACEQADMTAFLLDRGCPVDARSAEGATTLMNAVQEGNVEKTALLLDGGADVNAADDRGFTSLHRAAEMGHLDVVRLLLERGAEKTVEAQGVAPRDLAEKRKHQDIVAMLNTN